MGTHLLRERVMVNQKGLEGKPILKWKTESRFGVQGSN